MIDLLRRHGIIAWPQGRAALVATPYGAMRISRVKHKRGLRIDHPKLASMHIVNEEAAIREVRKLADSMPCDLWGRPAWLSVRCADHALEVVHGS